MQGDAYLKCIDSQCGLEYPITNTNVECENGHLLDVKYKNKPNESLKEVFAHRGQMDKNIIFNESGVWRFRELLNFCEIDTENIKQCSKYLVSLDGAEGRQSKPYHMTKVSSFIGITRDGNTSASAGMFAANEGIQCDVYIPAGQIAPGKLSQAYQFGAQIVEVDGNFDDALKQSLDDAKNYDGYTVNSINPFRIEGQKTIPYRALEYLRWESPDWIVYPGGALGNTSSCGKALMELYDWGWIKKIPRIAVINSEGASTLSDLYNGKFQEEELRWNKGNPNAELVCQYYEHLDKEGIRPKTKATAIQIGRPANILKG
ncbi:MAG: pyridoxal-phosphate dependent enzyme, partial [Nitrosopumilaceae archaeon]